MSFLVFLTCLAILSTAQDKESNPDWWKFKRTPTATILGAYPYFKKLMGRTAEIMEETHVSGVNFPIQDYSTNIHIELDSGYLIASGNVSLTHGFVNNVEKFTTQAAIRGVIDGDRARFMPISVKFQNVHVMFDIEFSSIEGKSVGATRITIPTITFQLEVWETLVNPKIGCQLTYQSFDCENLLYKTYPYDRNMQFAIRGVRRRDD